MAWVTPLEFPFQDGYAIAKIDCHLINFMRASLFPHMLILIVNKPMTKKIPQFIWIGLGTAAVILLYTRFLGAEHQFDWGRAIVVGLVCALGNFIWPTKK